MAKSSLAIVAAVAAALIASLAVAVADGYFPNFPIVGGASYCGGYATGTTGQVCNQTVPAGPTALTGNETVIADTHLGSGQSPQTVAIDVSSLGAGPTQYSVPVAAGSITIAAGTRQVIIEPAGTLATLTLVFPAAASLTEGQRFGFCTTQIITALTITNGSGATVVNPPSAMAVPNLLGQASCVEWVYVASTTKWYRTQ